MQATYDRVACGWLKDPSQLDGRCARYSPPSVACHVTSSAMRGRRSTERRWHVDFLKPLSSVAWTDTSATQRVPMSTVTRHRVLHTSLERIYRAFLVHIAVHRTRSALMRRSNERGVVRLTTALHVALTQWAPSCVTSCAALGYLGSLKGAGIRSWTTFSTDTAHCAVSSLCALIGARAV